ncbi:MAG: Calx-beta domain-containing protein [Nostoc sp. ChiQUE02]|uniref:Calx-beta domain-containing protein n=1 Tax=Nostoc sp. ChiQUE02 TaxID=3075377 RepID=UPI002AD2C94A|nr:Calx-beta domain-containing protein [Nostoc sp. ChiQUE02]MDZ8228921.1 Calx-beta domain-containing protein [Nostoc sp. ChiQUE02]
MSVYNTSDRTAKISEFDYNSGLGTIVFNPGETLKTISFGVRGDKKVEANETFFVNLYGAANAAIADSQGMTTITNDDSQVFYFYFYF